MTSISSVYADQWLRALNVNETDSATSGADKQKKGDTTSLALGDTVSISEQARLLAGQSSAGQSQTESEAQSDSGGGASATAESAMAFGSSSASSVQEQIEEIEQKIEELGQEIAQLQGKVSSDPNAKTQLDAKLNELAQLQAQLTQLKQQQLS
ncbi:hypothetical protein DPQ33_06300 [Oceanidesulfovibrio indonesiensis]|uniref:FlxA-like protein n=1 Tax=Oceanidesulfovibrio indonesiensis TaxID=54767 RepID=A0A7M3MH28_9BACT|nr:hypothetical protein [Oceanidesulfovibrio indonesiensis]TVM18360.1 hypothetical protein DPQ33_06300 [Oceanidesulfovibrio indonesiensis]